MNNDTETCNKLMCTIYTCTLHVHVVQSVISIVTV